MENSHTIKETEIGKGRMGLKILKMLFFSLIRLRFYLPGIPEIQVEELYDLIKSNHHPLIIDTRDEVEFYSREGTIKKYGHIPNAKLLPIFQLPANLIHLSSFKDKEIVTICPGGGASLVACEVMLKAGFTDVKSLRGGMNKWHKKGYPTTTGDDPMDKIYLIEDGDTVQTIDISEIEDGKYRGDVNKSLDARNLSCPKPILMSKKAIGKLKIGQVLEILATDPGSRRDIPAWANLTGQELISTEENSPNEFRFIIRKQKS